MSSYANGHMFLVVWYSQISNFGDLLTRFLAMPAHQEGTVLDNPEIVFVITLTS